MTSRLLLCSIIAFFIDYLDLFVFCLIFCLLLDSLLFYQKCFQIVYFYFKKKTSLFNSIYCSHFYSKEVSVFEHQLSSVEIIFEFADLEHLF